jgi:hypothetical protein|tara:strand:+ start:2210 stop:2656 length:447 start_codon:yes stop_codon:yes gene_type:complete
MNNKKNITYENIIGVIFALLIICEFNFEDDIKIFINTPIGTIIMFIFSIFLFMYYNPIISILFLIFVYDNIKDNYNYKLDLTIPSMENDFISNKMDIVNNNNKQIKDVEINIIRDMSPIIKKNENVNSNFNPNNNILHNTSLKYSNLL